MCGIVGILGKEHVSHQLIDALKRLEYRGYDSAGIATFHEGQISRLRAEGKLKNLETRLHKEGLDGHVGIGHTRWATHGAPVERNAHPHISNGVSLVHNGIIENFRDLRKAVEQKGFKFETDTDTEVIAHLISSFLANGDEPKTALQNTLAQLKGAFALAILFQKDPNHIFVARKGSPLALGIGKGEMFIGSDAIALAPFTNKICYLDDEDWGYLSHEGFSLFDKSGNAVEREIKTTTANALLIDKGNHRHFMAKEIHEQPEVISNTLTHYIDFSNQKTLLSKEELDFSSLSRLSISACGTAYYAGLAAKYWFERYAQLPVEIDVASEFRYREPPMPEDGAALFISQSGETADTLATLEYCKTKKQKILSIVNVHESSIARASDVILPTLAGPEIGVASTKAFTCQLSVLAALAICAGRQRGVLNEQDEKNFVQALIGLPRIIHKLTSDHTGYEAIAHNLSKATDVLYLGRGSLFPIALEGALKLKEISYIHAEAYAAGELKHGPIALIDEKLPVIVLAPKNNLFEKTISNMQEVAARGGRVILITDVARETLPEQFEAFIRLPVVHELIAPIVYTIPVQQLAYYTAVAMGTDVDQPRNLAKSVTVE